MPTRARERSVRGAGAAAGADRLCYTPPPAPRPSAKSVALESLTLPKRVRLAYGRSGLELSVPDAAEVITPRYLPGVPHEAAALPAAFRAPIAGPPLVDRVPRGSRLCSVV